MTLPKQLTQSFDEINASPLIAGSITKKDVQLFVDCINRAIPSPRNPMLYSVYRFNRTKYIADKERFVNDIKGFSPYEAMILWTDFKDILSFFQLENKIFLGWDKANNRYRGFALSSEQSVRVLRRGETLSDVATQTDQPVDTTQPSQIDDHDVHEGMDDDMHRVYEYMRRAQERIASLEEETKG